MAGKYEGIYSFLGATFHPSFSWLGYFCGIVFPHILTSSNVRTWISDPDYRHLFYSGWSININAHRISVNDIKIQSH